MAHDDRLRIIEHDAERHTAAAHGEAVEQTANQRLDALSGHEDDMDPARVLEAIRREMQRAPIPIEQAHAHLAEIELREFAGYSFKAHLQRGGDRRPHAGEHPIDGAQA